IVYGTLKEKQPQREAAELLQKKIARRWYNVLVPIKADDEVSEDDLKSHHLLLIGRSDSNAVAARFAKGLPVTFGPGSFVLRGHTYAHPGSAVIVAGDHPLSPRHSVVLFAGLSAEATWHSVQRLPDDGGSTPATETLLLAAGSKPVPLIASPALNGKP